ncbi:MAG: sigma-E factor negative regulatory protein [Gammaproteobacteria bacterium]|nr:sigma-E factor negative regulatory protein [Gammaproteobacteria bacterium]
MRWGCVLSDSNNALREMVSALVDGEASEFECRRVLAGMDDPALRGLVDRHYSLRAVVRQEAQLLCPAPLGANILAALEQEPALRAASAAPAGNRWRMRAGGAAVAASVCFLALIGMRALAPSGDAQATLASNGVTLGSLGQPVSRPLPFAGSTTPLGLARAVSDDFGGARTVGGSNQLAEQRLRLFMADHARNAALNTNQGMMPLARVASYQSP